MEKIKFAFRNVKKVVLRALIFLTSVILAGLVIADEVIPQKHLILRGQYTQGGLVIGKAVNAKAVYFDGNALKMSKKGDFVFGFGRDDEQTHELTVINNDNAKYVQQLTAVKREYQIQKIDGIPKKIMSPSTQDLKRIQEEADLVRTARQLNDDRTDFVHPFQWPLIGRISGVYGSQRVFNGVPKRPHFGVDVAAPVGTLVVAPADGIVTLYHPNMFYSGGTLIIDHGHGLSSTFIHLNKGLVEKGQVVKQGDIIAEVGQSGRATGPHLDWRMNWFSVRIDPALVAGTMPGTMPSDESSKTSD